MKDMNRVYLLGRLGNEPVQRSTRNGKSVVQFPLATSRFFTSSDESTGEEKKSEETEWHRVVVWGKQGEACAKHLVKGQAVLVEGSIRSHQFDGKDGVKRTSFEVVADSVSFLDKPRGATQH
jgi:single-strand DNA-binding protein